MKVMILLCSVLFFAGCAGMRKSENSAMAHAESFNILFLQIPDGDTQKRAKDQLPDNVEVHTMLSTPDDMTSITGILNRILGVSTTQVSGVVK